MQGNEIQKRLSDNIRILRKTKKITQFQLAEKTDLSEDTIKRIELLRQWPSEGTLAQIADALGVDVYRLFLPPTTQLLTDSQKSADLKHAIAEELRTYVDTVFTELTGE